MCVVPNRALDTWKKDIPSGMLEYHMDPQMYQFILTETEAEGNTERITG